MDVLTHPVFTRKLLGFALTIACLCFLMTLMPAQAYANSVFKSVSSAKGTVAISYEKGDADFLFSWDSEKYAAPENVRLSNTKVARVALDKNVGWLKVKAKKTGATTLTYTFRGKGHKVKLKVYKYKNPVRSFIIGGKQYKSKFNKKSYLDFGTSRDVLPTGKLHITPAKNWKLKGIEFVWAAAGKKIKNHASMPKNADFMRVTLYNKKTKVTQELIMCTSPWQ